MHLYFLASDNRQYLVAKDVDPYEHNDVLMTAVDEDLAKRRPDFTSYYKRTWFDNYHRYWIDYGSHTEFYICQEPKQALHLEEIDEEEDMQ